MAYQIDMFAKDEVDELRCELESVKKEVKNLRRGLFGRYDQVLNEMRVVKEDIHVLQDFLDLKEENEKVLQFSFLEG